MAVVKSEAEGGSGLPPLGALVLVPPPPAAGDTFAPPRPVGAPCPPGAAAVAAARSELLALDAALPEDATSRAMCPVRGSAPRRAAWRRMVHSAETPRALAMAGPGRHCLPHHRHAFRTLVSSL